MFGFRNRTLLKQFAVSPLLRHSLEKSTLLNPHVPRFLHPHRIIHSGWCVTLVLGEIDIRGRHGGLGFTPRLVVALEFGVLCLHCVEFLHGLCQNLRAHGLEGLDDRIIGNLGFLE